MYAVAELVGLAINLEGISPIKLFQYKEHAVCMHADCSGVTENTMLVRTTKKGIYITFMKVLYPPAFFYNQRTSTEDAILQTSIHAGPGEFHMHLMNTFVVLNNCDCAWGLPTK